MKILLIIFIAFSLNASELREKIQNSVGQINYQKHSNLIQNIFKNEALYYNNHRVNFQKMHEKLSKNSLINLKYPQITDIKLIFETTNSSVQSIKMINDTLNTLGYSYYFNDYLYKEDQTTVWGIRLKSEAMINPYEFIKELKRSNAIFKNVQKIDDTQWKYTIDFTYANIKEAISISRNEKVKLKKSVEPYMIKVKNANELHIKSSSSNTWYPYISFYDKNLNYISSIKNDILSKDTILGVPRFTKYILIGDSFTQKNIKRGLTVTVR